MRNPVHTAIDEIYPTTKLSIGLWVVAAKLSPKYRITLEHDFTKEACEGFSPTRLQARKHRDKPQDLTCVIASCTDPRWLDFVERFRQRNLADYVTLYAPNEEIQLIGHLSRVKPATVSALFAWRDDLPRPSKGRHVIMPILSIKLGFSNVPVSNMEASILEASR